MVAKYEIHGYIKLNVDDDWIPLKPPQLFGTDNYLQIQDSLRRAGIKYYIIEVRKSTI